MGLIMIFVANQLFENLGGKVYFLYSYLDDLIFFPIILSTILIIEQFFRHNWSYIIPFTHVLSAFLIFSLLLELVFPKFSERFTADPIDVLAYFIGSVFYYLFLNKPRIILGKVSMIRTIYSKQ